MFVWSESILNQSSKSRTITTSLAMSDENSESSATSFDLVVVGAGPVGIQAALAAARPPFNKSVCVVDAPRFTGVLMDERENKVSRYLVLLGAVFNE